MIPRTSSNIGRSPHLLLVLTTLASWATFALAQDSAPQNGLRVNEFMAVNATAHQNAHGDYEDWIEIHSPWNVPIDLAGYHLADEYPPREAWQIPSGQPKRTTVPAHGYLVLYADGKTELGADHLGFKLSGKGEQIVLLDKDGAALLDSVTYPDQLRDVSCGRSTDSGAQWLYSTRPTPGSVNQQGYTSFTLPPSVDRAAGIYDEGLTASVRPRQLSETVRYTLDGSDPTETSPQYAAPIRVDRTAAFKARAFSPGALPGQLASRFFLVGADHVLPVLALITDPAGLYDPDTGIFVHDLPGRQWERFCELFFIEDHQLAFQVPAGARVQGNTGPQEYDKKSLRLFFRDEYGEKKLKYPLFPGDPVAAFDRIVLRSGYDDSVEPTSSGNARATLLRDPLVTELWRQAGGLASRSRFAVLYLNDRFHGIYDIKQNIDAEFVADHLGYDEVDLLRTRWDSVEVTHGSREKWDELTRFLAANTLEDDDDLARVAQLLDLENYATLQALVHATQYSRWAYGVSMFRQQAPEATWQWTVWDADRTFNDANWNGFTTLFNPMNRELDSLITQKLLGNPTYRTYFINRLADLLNTVFAPENVFALVDSLAYSIAPEIPSEVDRWNNTVARWNDSVAFLKTFAQQRPAILRQQMQEFFQLDGPAELTVSIATGEGVIRVNTLTVDRFPWSGTYFRNLPVTVTAVPAPGYHFAGWSDPSLPARETVSLELTEDHTLSASFTRAGGIHAELIAPKRLRPGQRLPFVARIRNPDGTINPIDQTPLQVTFDGARADTVIQIKRGAGTGVSPIAADTPFTLTVQHAALPPTRKTIEVSPVPTVSYSGTLPTGDVVWDRTADRLITADLTVPDGCHLIVEPGTWIVGEEHVNFFVYGKVSVRGAPEEPVVITSENPSEPWGGMEFHTADASFRHCMVINGGGDLTKGRWHTGHQHIFYGINNAEFVFDQCFFLNSPGKVFGAADSKVTVTNSVSSFVWHGGEFHRVLLFYQDSHIMNIPNDDHIYEYDIDTDGFHIDFIYPKYPDQYSVIDRCYFVTGKDDAIDHLAARLRISNCWIEDFVHEGVAASVGDTVRIFNTIAIDTDQGFEAGYTERDVADGPHVFIDHCVAIGNNVGLRIGDSYNWDNWTYTGRMYVTNTILYDNADNIVNYLHSTQAPLEGAIDISHSMTNDPDYDALSHNTTGVPQFDPYYYLQAGSPGIGLGMDGTDMGRADSTALDTGSGVADTGSGVADTLVDLTSSNLPILVIRTDGEPIPDEPKIGAWMGIIDNGPGQRNRITDPFDGYEGRIGIEIRGSSAQYFPKKSYALETRDEQGENRNVPLLGMPSENDWILHAPYSDKSLVRNAYAYWLANQMGYYASRTRFCEVILDGDYQGVYVLMEKIKRDADRVDIARLEPDEVAGENLTGGYIIKVDRMDASARGWHSPYAFNDAPLFYHYYYPAPDDIAPAQEAYIQGFIGALEEALAGDRFSDPEQGYARYIDVGSFVDHLIVNEVARNNDAYRLSTFMHKHRDSDGGRLRMGPVWDFNLAFGNVDYNVHPSQSLQDPFEQGLMVGNGFTWYSVPFWFWWRRLVQDEAFIDAVDARWRELRQGVLSTENLTAQVESLAAHLDEAQARNFTRWPVLGERVWPNLFIGRTYREEIDFLAQWLDARLAWMDENFLAQIRRVRDIPPDDLSVVEEPLVVLPTSFVLEQNFPNPFNSKTLIRFSLPSAEIAELTIYNTAGQRVTTLVHGPHQPGTHGVRWDARDGQGKKLGNGVYLYRLQAGPFSRTRKLLLLQ